MYVNVNKRNNEIVSKNNKKQKKVTMKQVSCVEKKNLEIVAIIILDLNPKLLTPEFYLYQLE